MLVKKGTVLIVQHSRKGKFTAVAPKDFDTDDMWYHLTAISHVDAILPYNEKEAGDSITVRGDMCKLLYVN